MPPVALVNRLVSGALTMACVTLKHRPVALSLQQNLMGLFKGKNKTIYSADVMQTSNTAGLCRQCLGFFTAVLCYGIARIRGSNSIIQLMEF